jgi:2-methylcitrate dehydratase PrpD
MPATALEGKFSIPFCMAVAVLERKAGIAQFKDGKVRGAKVVDLMKRVSLYVDDELEALGYDQVRSRVRVTLRDGRTLERRADVARGHPLKPMSWDELAEKFHDCARLVIPRDRAEQAVDLISKLEKLSALQPLLKALSGNPRNKTRRKKSGGKR